MQFLAERLYAVVAGVYVQQTTSQRALSLARLFARAVSDLPFDSIAELIRLE